MLDLLHGFNQLRSIISYTDAAANLVICGSSIRAVPRFTETKPKYRNETEIPERTTKNIGKMLLVSKCWGEMDNEVFS